VSVLDAFQLDGRTALVTGATGGLGEQAAIALADAGATVVVTGRREERLNAVVDRIRALGGSARARVLDMTDAAAVRATLAEAAAESGHLDVLVNNAAQAHQADLLEITDAQWAGIVEVNLTAVFTASQQFVRLHSEAGDATRPASIVNIASLAATIGVRGQAAYVASKSGVAGLTRALALDTARTGLRVNALSPGYFATDMPGEVLADEAATAALLKKIPMRRIGEPAEIGPAVVFLASDASRYMTGAIINFDGGYTAA